MDFRQNTDIYAIITKILSRRQEIKEKEKIQMRRMKVQRFEK